jgi:nitrogen regulatory protein P-II 1
MKLVLAVIKPQRLDAVKDALRELGVDGMTSVEAQGFGRQGSPTEIYRGAQLQLDFVPMVQVEVVTSDQDVDGVVGAIVKAARTGKAGDGHVLVLPVDQVHRIRTGESEPRVE